MRRAGLHCLAVLALLFFSSTARAQHEPGGTVAATECCLDILFPVGARTVALGQALVARPLMDAVYVNPAGLLDFRKSAFVVSRTTIGDSPLNSFSFFYRSRVAGVFGITYRLIDYGALDATDGSGNVTGKETDVASVLVASFATPVALGWSAGINYKLYNFSANCSGVCQVGSRSGTSQMIDIGVRYLPRFLPDLALGASMLQAGLKLQINNAAQADVTPSRLRVGASYNAAKLITSDSGTAVWINADVVQRLHNATSPGVNIGVEVVLDNTIFIRAGHASEAQGTSLGGNAVGLGLRYQRFDINVAKSVSSSPIFDKDPFYVTLGVSF